MVTRPADAEATQVVTRPVDHSADTTQVVGRGDADTTQVVGRGDADTTQVVSAGGAVPGQRTNDDSETTTVIPPVDPHRR